MSIKITDTANSQEQRLNKALVEQNAMLRNLASSNQKSVDTIQVLIHQLTPLGQQIRELGIQLNIHDSKIEAINSSIIKIQNDNPSLFSKEIEKIQNCINALSKQFKDIEKEHQILREHMKILDGVDIYGVGEILSQIKVLQGQNSELNRRMTEVENGQKPGLIGRIIALPGTIINYSKTLLVNATSELWKRLIN